MTTGDRIRQRRKEIHMTQEELAKSVHSTKQSIYKYEKGIVTNIPYDTFVAIAKTLRVSPAYLMGWEEEDTQIPGALPIHVKKFPVLGNIACGEPTFAEQSLDTYVYTDEELNADFCLIAKGDSMINARIHDGDAVFIRKQDMVDDGEIAAVLIGDEATLKRVQYDKDNNVLVLFPDNPQYRPQVFAGAELSDVRILGKAVAFQATLK